MLPNCCHGNDPGEKITGFPGIFRPVKSFPLNGCRRFAGNVVYNSVNMPNLIHNAHGNLVQNLVGDTGPIGGHKIGGGDSDRVGCNVDLE